MEPGGDAAAAAAAGAEAFFVSWPMEERKEKPVQFLREIAALLRDLSSSPSLSSLKQLRASLEAASALLGGTVAVPPSDAAAAALAGFSLVCAAADVVVRSCCCTAATPSAAAAAPGSSPAATDIIEGAIEALSRAAELSRAWHARLLQSESESAAASISSTDALLLEASPLDAAASAARAINASFFCEPWLAAVGQERFAAASARLRAALKDSLAPAAAAALAGRRREAVSSCSSPSVARLGETVEALTGLGVRAAVAVRGGGGGGGGASGNGGGGCSPAASASLPLPMRSFALINVAVLGASRLLSAVPEEEETNEKDTDRELIRSAASGALAALCGPAAAAASDLARVRNGSGSSTSDAERASKLTPVRFWAQHVLKLAAAHPKGCVVSSSGASNCGGEQNEEAGRRFAGALLALAGAEAELSLSALSSCSSSSSTPLAAAKGVISKAAAAVAACWANCAEEEEGSVGAASSALAALLQGSGGGDDDARASALVLLLQATSKSFSSSSTVSSAKLVSQVLPELARRASRGQRALRDSAWRDGAAAAAAEGLAASAASAAAPPSPSSPSPLWHAAERALFEAALECPTPAARELLGEAWAGLFRRLLRRASARSARRSASSHSSSPPSSSSSPSDAVSAAVAAHASALAAAAAGAAAIAAASRDAPSSCASADAEALSEHLALLSARVLSAFPPSSSAAAAPLKIACSLLEEADEALAVAQGRAEAAAAAAAVVKVAAAVAAGGRPSDDSSEVKAAERDLRSAADALLRRASASLLSAAEDTGMIELPGQGGKDLEASLLLVAALCAGCSPSFDEGGFLATEEDEDVDADGFRAIVAAAGVAADGKKASRTAEEENELKKLCRRAGLLGLPRSRVEAVASRVASLGPLISALSSSYSSSSPGCRSAALRALAAAGLPPSIKGKPSRGGGNANLLLLMLPASLAEGARADPRVAAAAAALAPLVAAAAAGQGKGGGGAGEGKGVEALYRVLLATAAATSSSSSFSSSSPCFVALHTTAASLVAHARAGGGDVRSCVPGEMLPPRPSSSSSGRGKGNGEEPSAWPFLEMVKAIMKREAPVAAAASPSSPSSSSSSSPSLDAAALSAALAGAAARASAAAAAAALAAGGGGIGDKVARALASLREAEAAAEAVGGGGGGGVGGKGGRSSSALALEEVAAAAQRLKRRCV